MKTAEMKIQFYTEGKKTFCRVLIYDTRHRIWCELTGLDNDVAALISHADEARKKFENGMSDRVKMLKNTEYGVMLNAKK